MIWLNIGLSQKITLYHPRFGFMSITGHYSIPRNGFCFYCAFTKIACFIVAKTDVISRLE